MLHDLVPGVQALPKLFAELQLISGLPIANAKEGGVLLRLLLRLAEDLPQELNLLGLEEWLRLDVLLRLLMVEVAVVVDLGAHSEGVLHPLEL
jgi:hypothetical protein